MRGSRHTTRVLAVFLFVPSFLSLFYLTKLIDQLHDSKTYDAELISRITAITQPISLPSASSSRFVIMTVGTFAYKDFVTNLACSFLNSSNGSSSFQILLLSLDSRLHTFPMPPNVHSVYFNVTTTKKFTGKEQAHRYGNPGFDIVTRQKFAAIRAVLSAGFDVLYMDGDIVWCDPSRAVTDIAAQAHHQNAPIVAQTGGSPKQLMNTGLFYAIAVPDTINFLYSAEMLPPEEGNDQSVANKLACKENFGGAQLDLDHCRWRNMNIRVLEPKSRYILGASKIEGTEMRRLKHESVNRLCNSKEIALMHYSYYSYSAKRKAMMKDGYWFYNSRTLGTCSNYHVYKEI